MQRGRLTNPTAHSLSSPHRRTPHTPASPSAPRPPLSHSTSRPRWEKKTYLLSVPDPDVRIRILLDRSPGNKALALRRQLARLKLLIPRSLGTQSCWLLRLRWLTFARPFSTRRQHPPTHTMKGDTTYQARYPRVRRRVRPAHQSHTHQTQSLDPCSRADLVVVRAGARMVSLRALTGQLVSGIGPWSSEPRDRCWSGVLVVGRSCVLQCLRTGKQKRVVCFPLVRSPLACI